MSRQISQVKSQEEERKNLLSGFVQECLPGFKRKSWSRSLILSQRPFRSKGMLIIPLLRLICSGLIAVSICSFLTKRKRKRAMMKKNCWVFIWGRWQIWELELILRSRGFLLRVFLLINKSFLFLCLLFIKVVENLMVEIDTEVDRKILCDIIMKNINEFA